MTAMLKAYLLFCFINAAVSAMPSMTDEKDSWRGSLWYEILFNFSHALTMGIARIASQYAPQISQAAENMNSPTLRAVTRVISVKDVPKEAAK